MSTVSATAPAWTQGLRLPGGVVPRRYDLALAPDLERTHSFAGHICIELTVVDKPTSEIVLHSFELTYPDKLGAPAGTPDVQLLSVAAAGASSVELQNALRVELDDAASQRARITFAQPIEPGEYVLAMRFNGTLNDQLAAVTQMEATDCRRAIPCWDEPAIKAVFAVTLVVAPDVSAVSNMPAKRCQTVLGTEAEQKADPACRGLVVPRGFLRYEYIDTPVMSSYLLAFVVGEFDYISSFTEPVAGVKDSGRVELRIYTPVGQTKQGEFAMDVALKCLALYEQFFQLAFPLPKLDLLAIPDFASGAMENWGAITYRDTMLLIDPDQSSALIKQRCAKTIAHEIAHMWFGNLVTMEWWNSLWLNEGFARYCESWATDAIFPDWQVMDQFINEVYGMAQNLDSLASSHAVEIQVSSPEEINEIFDVISYNKGASLIRMLIETIGEAAFRRGLQHYLHHFAYKNTTSKDLFASFSQATVEEAAQKGGVSIDIEALMEQWVKTMGYPCIQVEETDESAAAAASVKKGGCRCFLVSQSKFLQSGAPAAAAHVPASASSSALVAAADAEPLNGGVAPTTWSVPLAIGAYSSALSSAKTLAITHRILDKLVGTIEIETDALAEESGKELQQTIYSFNHASTGFYRVHYAPALFSSLSSLVSKQLLPPLDRLSLLRDCYSLSACGQGYTVANLLDLLLLFENESNFVVGQFIAIVLGAMCSLHAEQAYYPQLQKVVAKLFAKRWAQLGWGPAPVVAGASSSSSSAIVKKEHHLIFLERAILLQMVGSFGGSASAEAIQSRAFEMLQSFAADPTNPAKAIQPDLRAPVYALAIKARGQAARDILIKLYQSTSPPLSSEERVRILSSLGTTRGLPSTVAEDTAEIQSLLAWVFAPNSEVRTGDLIYALTSIGQDSKLARTLCWRHMQANWDALMSKFKGMMFVLGRIFPSVLGEMSSEAECVEFETWFASHPVVGAERSVKQASETVRMKIDRLNREVPLMQQWMAAHTQQL